MNRHMITLSYFIKIASSYPYKNLYGDCIKCNKSWVIPIYAAHGTGPYYHEYRHLNFDICEISDTDYKMENLLK